MSKKKHARRKERVVNESSDQTTRQSNDEEQTNDLSAVEQNLRKISLANQPLQENEPHKPCVLSELYTVPHRLPEVSYYFTQYSGREEELDAIMQLMASDLSEPYSIFTYRYFLNTWPDLCVLCKLQQQNPSKGTAKSSSTGENVPESGTSLSDASEDPIIGCIINKVDRKSQAHPLRGYIAMLAVEKKYRKCGIGSELVCAAVDLMKQTKCEWVYLETPIENNGALRLYENLSFARDKRLAKYYLSGSDAFRLKLWLS